MPTRDLPYEIDTASSTERELLDLLFQNAPLTLFSSSAIAILLLSALYNSQTADQAIVSWVIVMILLNLARLILRSFRDSSLISNRYSPIWLHLYTFSTFLAGALWASLVLIYEVSFDLYEQIITLATLLGIPIAAMPNNALKLRVYYAFCAPIVMALQYWSYFVAPEAHLEFSMLAIAYTGILVVTGHIYHSSFRKLLRTKYEKQELVDELSAANRRLEEFAYIDPLTGLTNRRWFSEQADRALDRCHRNNKRLAILLIDLDNFKQINDTLGHDTGDEILIVVAKRLKSALRTTDTMTLTTEDTARYGGDEFILLLEDFNKIDDVTSASERILQEVNEQIVFNDHSFSPGCSIGISIYPDDGDSVTNLIRRADVALYQAKQSGKGCTRFFQPLPVTTEA